MAKESNTGPGLRDMAFAAAGGNRKSSNALVDAANKVFASYADQMADAAAQRRAARQDAKMEKEKEKQRIKEYGSDSDGDGVPNSLDPNYANKSIIADSDSDGNPDYVDFTEDPSLVNVPLKPPGMPMRSPIKSLYDAAFAAKGGYREDTKNAGKLVDDLAKAAIEARRTTQRVLKEKVVKELENFSPQVVDLEGFNGFMNGKEAVTNFGIDLKKQIAEKRDTSLKLNPYSMEYKQTMSEINSLVESTKTLNMEKMRLANLKKEWGTSSKNNLYSKGSSKTTMHYLKQVMSQTAGMELDENGQVVFNVARLDDPTIIEKISFDDLNKDLYLKVELDVGQKINDYHTMIRKNNYDNLGFNKDGNKTFWNTLIAPDEESVSFDGELLSWIHDKPYNMYSNTSFYQDFKEYFKGKPLAIGEDGAPVIMNQNAIDALFDTDTRDWDVELVAGTNANGQPIIKTVRDYIREELVNYYARTSEQYHYYLTQKQDITRSTVGKSIEETNVNTEFSN